MRLIESLFRKKGRKESLFRYLMSVSHLWLGLLSSIVLFIVCLAGSLYAFRSPTHEYINRKLLNTTVSESEKSLQTEEIEALFIDRNQVIESIVIPAASNKNLIISYRDIHLNRQATGYFNPFTGEEVKGAYNHRAEPFFQSMLALHRNLMLGHTGKQIVGLSVIIFVSLLLSGLVLWWPRSWRWRTVKAALRIRWKSGFFQVIYGLHKVVGFYTFLLLLFIAITGLYIAYPWMKNAVIITLGGESILQKKTSAEEEVSESFAALMQEMLEKEKEKTADSLSTRFALSQVHAMANNYLGYDATTTIVMANTLNPRYHVVKVNANNPFGAKVTDEVTFDQMGEMRSLERFSDLPLHQKFIEISLPLHTGEIIGLPGIILYAFISLIGCSLPVTGFLIWWKKAGKAGRPPRR